MNKFSLILLFAIYFLLLQLAPEAEAQDMSSQNYKLQGGNFNTSSSTQSSSGFRLVDLVGQTSAQIFTSKGYLIKSGFFNQAISGSLSFSISPTLINFGTLTPLTPVIENLLITASSGELPGFTVYIAQNKQLETETGATIPDTVCDASYAKICTINKAGLWIDDSSYGFGYSLQGKTVPKDFTDNNFFRPFPSLLKKEQPVIVLESHEKNKNESASMALKLIVSKQQAVGIYRNVLLFTAMPGI